jgi:hypothetical protein
MPENDTRSAPSGATLYYIRCTVEDAGYSVLWWRPDGNGYTDKLIHAGKYTAEEVARRTSRDVGIPVEVADAAAVLTVPASLIDSYQHHAKLAEGPRS